MAPLPVVLSDRVSGGTMSSTGPFGLVESGAGGFKRTISAMKSSADGHVVTWTYEKRLP